MTLNQVQSTSISPFYESLLDEAMHDQESQERLARAKINHSDDQCSSVNMPSRSNQNSTGRHSKFEKPIQPNYSNGNEGNFCSNEDNRRSTPSRPQVCAPTYRIKAQEQSFSEENTSSKQSLDRRRDDGNRRSTPSRPRVSVPTYIITSQERSFPKGKNNVKQSHDDKTWKAIQNGHSTIVCCNQCNYFLEAPMGTSRMFCERCQRKTDATREPNKYNLLNKREILSLDGIIARVLQTREFQAQERKRGENTSDNLPKGLTNGMNEDLNNIFKTYERNVAPIDESDMVSCAIESKSNDL